MAYSHDRIADTTDAMSRDNEWFRVNQSKSGTPVSQERARDPIERDTRTNDQFAMDCIEMRYRARRRAAAAVDPLMDEARALMHARLLGKPLALPQAELAPMEPATRVAMHGGTAKGERFNAPKRRDKPMQFYCQPTVVPPREDRAAPAPAFQPTSFHAVADQRIARGRAEVAALEAARAEARARRR